MKLVLASRNPKKIRELRDLLAAFLPEIEVLSLDDVGIAGDIEENGADFRENALIKARAAATSGYLGVGDDSGLAVEALGGDPGIYSARYAARCGYGEEHNDRQNNEALLQNMQGLETDRRGAAFVCTIACVLPDGREFTVRGESKGHILTEYRGDGGFGYDPLFYVDELGKTFSQLTPEEKNAVSHRGRAIRSFEKRLQEELSNEIQ